VATRPVQGDHLELAAPLAQRVRRDRGLDQGQSLHGAAQVELGGCKLLQCGEPELRQSADVLLGELLIHEIGEWRTAPQFKRRTQDGHASIWVAVAEPAQAIRDELREATGIDRLRVSLEHVPGRPGADHSVSGQRLDGLPQLRDVNLDRVHGRARRVSRPHQVDQPVGGDDLVGVQDQDGQHGPLLGRPEVGRDPIGQDLKGSQNPVLHPSPPKNGTDCVVEALRWSSRQ